MTPSRTILLFLAALLGAVSVVGCNSSSGSTQPPPEQQVLAPSISPATGTFTSAQSVAITDATPSATIHYTTDGTTPTASSSVYSKTFTASTTITVEAIAVASGYTNSNVSTATLTINIPQSVSLPKTMAVSMGITPLVLDASVVTASASCGPSAVTWSVVINDSNKSTTGGNFASWTADSSDTTWGSISSGNTFSTNSINTYTVTATCGSASASSQLTVSDPAPTITAVSCSPSESSSACVIPATGSTTLTLTGTNFIESNQTVISTTDQEWWGTGAFEGIGACLKNLPNLQVAASWVSFTELQQSDSRSDSSDGGLGIGDYYVYNPAVSAGTGGGWDCLNNALTVVANSSNASTAGIVTLQPGTARTSGALSLRSRQSGQVIWQIDDLGFGSRMATVQGNLVYVPNKDEQTLSIVNLETRGVQNISIGDAKPRIATVSPKDGKLYLAAETPFGYELQSYTNASGLVVLISGAGQITDLKSDSEGRLVYLVQDAKQTELHRLDPSTGHEEILNLELPANQLSLTESGYLAYWTGEHHLALVDPAGLQQIAYVAMPNPVYTASAQYVGLSDGTIWEASQSGGTLRTEKVGQLNPNERFSGFVPDISEGHVLFYSIPADNQGKLSGPLSVHNQ